MEVPEVSSGLEQRFQTEAAVFKRTTSQNTESTPDTSQIASSFESVLIKLQSEDAEKPQWKIYQEASRMLPQKVKSTVLTDIFSQYTEPEKRSTASLALVAISLPSIFNNDALTDLISNNPGQAEDVVEDAITWVIDAGGSMNVGNEYDWKKELNDYIRSRVKRILPDLVPQPISKIDPLDNVELLASLDASINNAYPAEKREQIKRILGKRYGIEDWAEGKRSQEEIAESEGISTTRVGQIEESALAKIRSQLSNIFQIHTLPADTPKANPSTETPRGERDYLKILEELIASMEPGKPTYVITRETRDNLRDKNPIKNNVFIKERKAGASGYIYLPENEQKITRISMRVNSRDQIKEFFQWKSITKTVAERVISHYEYDSKGRVTQIQRESKLMLNFPASESTVTNDIFTYLYQPDGSYTVSSETTKSESSE